MDRVLSTSSFARKYRVYLVHSRLCSTLNTTWSVQSQLVRESCEVPCMVPVVQGHNTRVQCCTAAPNGQPSSAVKLCWGETVRLPCSLGEQHLWDAVPWCVCWRHAMSFMQIPCRKEPERSHALVTWEGCLYWDFVQMHRLQDWYRELSPGQIPREKWDLSRL